MMTAVFLLLLFGMGFIQGAIQWSLNRRAVRAEQRVVVLTLGVQDREMCAAELSQYTEIKGYILQGRLEELMCCGAIRSRTVERFGVERRFYRLP